MAHGNARAGKHKARYDRYKNQGRLEKNKALKQERAAKRENRFAKRREEGKAYVYTKRDNPNVNHVDVHDPAYLESVFRKLDNQIAAEKLEMKKKARGMKRVEQVSETG